MEAKVVSETMMSQDHCASNGNLTFSDLFSHKANLKTIIIFDILFVFI